MSNSVAYLKTAFMLSPLYNPATSTGRAVGRVVSAFTPGLRISAPAVYTSTGAGTSTSLNHGRHFSSTGSQQLKIKEFFPRPKNPKILYSPPAWAHPVYTEDQMHSISFQHRDAKNWSDKVALGFMRLLRFGLDKATFYAPEEKAVSAAAPTTDGGPGSTAVATKKPWLKMNERKWLIRLVFLESVAGVPGMVGGMLRHLHSLRRMKRDNGWIETLLEEAYNERMHLLTFLSLAEPGPFMRAMVLLAQGVFFNGFFLSYLFSPRTCHRFVGYLEEEAVYTYSRIIRDLEAGKLPEWADPAFKIPDIAVTYWKMPDGRQTMRDLLYYVRADEAKHREVNHTLGNLDQTVDPNPYTSLYAEDDARPHPSKGLDNHHPKGWERSDVM